jgi:hypothetical protein
VRRRLAICFIAAVALPGAAGAHGTGSHTGLVNTVVGTEPLVPGLVAVVLGEHERITVRNFTTAHVVMFGAHGRRPVRLEPGETKAWADPRIAWSGPLPDEEALLKNWRIPGEAEGRRFAIVGFLGYAPPPEESGSGASPWVTVAAVAGGVLLLVVVGVGARLLRRAPSSDV